MEIFTNIGFIENASHGILFDLLKPIDHNELNKELFMKAFLVGLFALVALLILSGVGILLLPLLVLLTFFLRIIVGFVLLLFAIWLFGKFILWIWDKMNAKN